LLVHAVVAPELLAFGPLTAEDVELEHRMVERNERVARDYLEHVRTRLCAPRAGVRILVEHDGGARASLLRAISREQPDLLVFSATGTTGHAGGPCGTVASHLLLHGGKPALMFRQRRERAILRSPRRQPASRLPTQARP
jgi:hypothetical protein